MTERCCKIFQLSTATFVCYLRLDHRGACQYVTGDGTSTIDWWPLPDKDER